ncbi:hypothetical protein CCGE525_14790 [Rhizobium jaguaris]|uniref:Uncharacterized protein n=1 Tax=Rhizobium jaguaris TaxID=1312183 RepID=A0A387FNI5_9HYPH|nr:hypothetical protein CCGE525_14790 [Rhizobium jaguaris]
MIARLSERNFLPPHQRDALEVTAGSSQIDFQKAFLLSIDANFNHRIVVPTRRLPPMTLQYLFHNFDYRRRPVDGHDWFVTHFGLM